MGYSRGYDHCRRHLIVCMTCPAVVVLGHMLPLLLRSSATVQLLDLEEDFVIESEETIYSTNLHFHVHNGVTLTFRAPAIKIAREEVKKRVTHTDEPWQLTRNSCLDFELVWTGFTIRMRVAGR